MALEEMGPCYGCGSTENLQFDHIEPKSKAGNIRWSWPQKKLAKELARCQVLCARCHMSKSGEDLAAAKRKTHSNRCPCLLCYFKRQERGRMVAAQVKSRCVGGTDKVGTEK